MKKLIATTVMLALGGILAYSQGTITIVNTSASYLIRTNTGSVSGLVKGSANSYFYTVLTSAYGGAAPATDLSSLGTSLWLDTGVLSANDTINAGGIKTPNTTVTANGTWGAPTGASYDTSTTMYYLVVGWSAGLGTTWAQVKALINGPGLTAGQYFGTSALAYNESGGGPNSLAAVNVLNAPGQTGLAGAGLTSGFFLNQVTAVPEPSTLVLAGLGGLSLLAFRRKK